MEQLNHGSTRTNSLSTGQIDQGHADYCVELERLIVPNGEEEDDDEEEEEEMGYRIISNNQ